MIATAKQAEKTKQANVFENAGATRTAKKLRVLHVLHSLDGGGAEHIVCDMARRWQNQLTLGCVCLDKAGSLGAVAEKLGVEVFVAGRRNGLDAVLPLKLANILRKFKPDIIHAHQYTPYMYAAVAATICPGSRVIFTEHGRHWPDVVSHKRRLFNNFLRLRRDRVTAVCKFAANALTRKEGLGSRISVIRNGVRCENYSQLAAAENSPHRLPAELFGFDAGDPVCLQVARLHPVKDHHTSIRAFSRVVEKIPNARLVIVGDGQLRSELEQLAADLKLTDNVIFAGERSDIPQLLAGSDLFVLSSVSEGASLSILEAMSASLAVVATDVGGNGEIVIHGRTGLLCPRADDKAMARNISALLADDQRRQRMGRYGRRLAVRCFDQKIMHDKFMNLYLETVGAGK